MVPGTAWDFGPNGLHFAHPVVMTIAYDPAQLPPGVDESELRIHKLVNGTYEQQNAGLVDLVNHTVSAEVNGFSLYVVIPRDPNNPEDVVAPDVRAVEFLDPGTGTYGPSLTLDVSSGDATYTTRVHITDNITGVAYLDVQFISPTGRQALSPCRTAAPPTSGNDTNGMWECQNDFAQFSEAGTWSLIGVYVTDKINNYTIYNQQNGFCDTQSGQCIPVLPQLTIVDATPDIDPPVLLSMDVSLDTQPRAFLPSVSVDAAAGGQTIWFGMHATDNLSGVGTFLSPYDFVLTLEGPSGQSTTWYNACYLTSGTPQDGFWECYAYLPAQAEPGAWHVSFMHFPDRVGNGGGSGYSYFVPDGNGQLCNQTGNCVASPTILVTSAGDNEAPRLQSLSLTENTPDVTTTMTVTDNASGVWYIYVRYGSTTSSQGQDCYAGLTAGTTTNGTWSCTITFSQYAVLGQWILSLALYDVAGNARYYYRRVSDGYLCYDDQSTGTPVCQNFGDTDLVLQ